MATYPIKMLKDENGTPFVPLISLDSVQDTEGQSINEILDKKLETANLIAGTQIELEVDGNNITISNSAEGTKLINNLETVQVGVGALDAHQGKVLLEKIPTIANNLNTPESGQALSAYQGYVLAGRVAPTGGAEGQVLKKASTDDYDFEWGNAADPNAIGGDGTIKKIVELSYQDYLDLKDGGQLDETTEYHINDWAESGASELKANQIELNNGIDLETAFNNKDIVDEGQNARLGVAEGSIDAIVNTVNNHASSLSNCETRINNLSNHVATNVMLVLSDYATSERTVNFTFNSGLFLVMSQVNGNDMCRVDLVYNGDGSSIAGRSTISALSNYITYTYGTNNVTISTNYTCLVRILRMP